MAMFDKHKSSKQPARREDPPAMSRPAADATAPTSGSAPAEASIGVGVSHLGDVSAKTNLKVEGRIEGRAVSSSHDVEVSETGLVKANISARVVKIGGAVAGDVNGSEKVLITKTGRVQGNIVAPRVQLDDGALFRGTIDMNPPQPANAKKPEAARPAAETNAKPASTTSAPAKTSSSSGAGKESSLTLKSG
jgi:cytoskeletal protein CcmA (bactofilin family)